MKPGLPVGETHEMTIRVTEDMQARFPDGPVHALYSTSAMIQHMEWAARQHILPYLEPGEEGVGHHVDVRHLAPAPVGAQVVIRSTVTEVQPRRVTSRVEAWMAETQLGVGQITQALVPLAVLQHHDVMPELPRDANEPEPATLVSADGQSRLQLAVVKWETGMFPCTRYDEWLICRAALQANGRQLMHEGAFLLRHEVEELLVAATACLKNPATPFQSDFLEPILNARIESAGTGKFQARLSLTRPASPSGYAGETLEAAFSVDQQALRQFSEQLAVQLEGFPSKL